MPQKQGFSSFQFTSIANRRRKMARQAGDGS
jgi:hypothetical protein